MMHAKIGTRLRGRARQGVEAMHAPRRIARGLAMVTTCLVITMAILSATQNIVDIDKNPVHKEFNQGFATRSTVTTVFSDNFDDGSLGSDWSTIYGGVSSQTCNSAPYSAYIYGYADSVTTRVVDLSGRSSANVSYWLRRGSSAFSEFPDAVGEGLYVEYYSNTGSWIQLEYYTPGGIEGEIFIRGHILSSNALHTNFMLRFRQAGGSGSGCDYWHFDDVIIKASDDGMTVFSDNFDDGSLGSDWSTIYGGVSSQTCNSTPYSAYIYGYADSVTTRVVDLSGRSWANVSYWLRRGSSSFSEYPDSGEDLYVEYLTSSGSWSTLATFPGGGPDGEIVTRTHTLPANALHAAFRLRFRQLTGSGSGYDYWHFDDVVIKAAAGTPVVSDVLFSDDFDDGSLGSDWSTIYGGVSSQTCNSAPYSAYIYGYADSVTTRVIDLSGRSSGNVSYWLRRGSSSFSEYPDSGEDLYVEYLTSSGSWSTLAIFPGGGSDGEIVTRTHTLPANALHATFQLRFRHLGGSGSGCDYWHFDDVMIKATTGTPVVSNVLFSDNFDDGSLGSDWWTVYGGVGTQTYNSAPCSAYIFGYSDSVTLNPFDLSSYNQGNVSYWLQRGSSPFSENPDDGEDLHIEYLSSSSEWVLLETFLGAGPAGEVFYRTNTLPSDAFHSGFQLRFRLVTGSGSGCDYWHFDDVVIRGYLGPIQDPQDHSHGAGVMATSLVIAGIVASFLMIVLSFKIRVKKFLHPQTQVVYRSTTTTPVQQGVGAGLTQNNSGIPTSMAMPPRSPLQPVQPAPAPLHALPTRPASHSTPSPVQAAMSKPGSQSKPPHSPFPTTPTSTGPGNIAGGIPQAPVKAIAGGTTASPGWSTTTGAGAMLLVESSTGHGTPTLEATQQLQDKTSSVEPPQPDVVRENVHREKDLTNQEAGSFDDVPTIAWLFEGEWFPEQKRDMDPMTTRDVDGHEVKTVPVIEAPIEVTSREQAELLRVAPAEPRHGNAVQVAGEKIEPLLILGCQACGTTRPVTRLSSELMYACKTCKQPLRVILECPACGNELVLTQDEYRADMPSGRHCPVCMEPVTG